MTSSIEQNHSQNVRPQSISTLTSQPQTGRSAALQAVREYAEGFRLRLYNLVTLKTLRMIWDKITSVLKPPKPPDKDEHGDGTGNEQAHDRRPKVAHSGLTPLENSFVPRTQQSYAQSLRGLEQTDRVSPALVEAHDSPRRVQRLR